MLDSGAGSHSISATITHHTLANTVDQVCRQDQLLHSLYQQFGYPPLWQRPQSFATLVHIVLEQKVSLASALAVMQRLRHLDPLFSPESFLRLPERAVREAGVSERKLSYCRSIAKALLARQPSLAALRHLSDDEVIRSLCAIRGVGPWSAGVYLLMAMRRQDAWASGDRALAVSFWESAGCEHVPDYAELDQHAQRWRPYRGAAARLLWHAYLQRRG